MTTRLLLGSQEHALDSWVFFVDHFLLFFQSSCMMMQLLRSLSCWAGTSPAEVLDTSVNACSPNWSIIEVVSELYTVVLPIPGWLH